MHVEELKDMASNEVAEAIGNNFASVSQEYQPLNLAALPSYHPAPQPPFIEDHVIYQKIKKNEIAQVNTEHGPSIQVEKGVFS